MPRHPISRRDRAVEIMRLRAAGLSTVAVARRLGIKESTVYKAARFLRVPSPAPDYRCLGCGYRVTVRPCVICAARAARESSRQTAAGAS